MCVARRLVRRSYTFTIVLRGRGTNRRRACTRLVIDFKAKPVVNGRARARARCGGDSTALGLTMIRVMTSERARPPARLNHIFRSSG